MIGWFRAVRDVVATVLLSYASRVGEALDWDDGDGDE